MSPSPLRTTAVCSLVLGSVLLPLMVPVALQYEGGPAPVALLASVHFLFLSFAGRLACASPRPAAPRVDFGEATA